MATQKREQHFARMTSRVISVEQRMKKELIERRGHEEWTRGLEEDWQSHLETLQKCVCELLLKNRQLRMGAAKLAVNPVGGSPACADCPVGTVAISSVEAGNHPGGSLEVKVLGG
jgi:hypothetical protein